MDTKQKILEASIKLFTKGGYLGTPTKAIANEANVSEMTIFRQFNTKQNLFESMLKYTLGHELSDATDVDFALSLKEFTKYVLHGRLLLISKHIKLVQMIIQESLQGRLPNELNFIGMMSQKLNNLFHTYCKQKKYSNHAVLSKHMLGIVLHYAIIDYSLNYHKMNATNQDQLLETLLKIITF